MQMIKLLFLLSSLSLISFVHSVVLGIDVGEQSIKVGAVAHGKGIHVMLDGQSKRKIPSLVFFDDSERRFGNEAVNSAIKKPDKAVSNFKSALGYNGDVEEALTRWPDLRQSNVSSNKKDGKSESVYFSVPLEKEHRDLSPSEILAMLLLKIKDFSISEHNFVISAASITVPQYFTQSQREAVLKAAKLAEIEVSSLISENAAAAIQYGVQFSGEKAKSVLFCNMGHSKTEISIFKFEKEKKNKKIKRIVEEMDYAFDDSLGGRDYSNALADFIISDFKEKKGFSEEDVFEMRKNKRKMAILKTKVEKAKKVLSVNKESFVTIEEFYDEKDIMKTVKRSEFVAQTKNLTARITALLAQLKEPFDEIVFLGGATRIPSLREAVKLFTKKNATKTLNPDEAPALGAAIRSAHKSAAFRIREVEPFFKNPFQVEMTLYYNEVDSSDSEKLKAKSVLLFKLSDYLDRKRSVAFNCKSDIQGKVLYSDSKLPAGQNPLVFQFSVVGASEFYALNKERGIPKVNIQFHLDENGMIKIANAKAFYKMRDNNDVDNKKENIETKKDDKKENIETKKDNKKENIETKKDDKKEEKMEMKLKIKYLDGKGSLESLSGNLYEDSLRKIQEFEKRDLVTKKTVEKMNQLQELTFKYIDVTETDLYKEKTTDEEKSKIAKLIKQTENWLSENTGDNKTSEDEYIKQIDKIHNCTKVVMDRLTEYLELPKAVEYANEVMSFVSKVVNQTIAKKPWIPEKEIKAFSEKSHEYIKWLQEKIDQSKKLAKTADPIIKYEDVVIRADELKSKAEEFSMREKIEKPKSSNFSSGGKFWRRRKAMTRRKSIRTYLDDFLKKTKQVFVPEQSRPRKKTHSKNGDKKGENDDRKAENGDNNNESESAENFKSESDDLKKDL
ncbi:hypothetical protein MHBO_000328 [Bonamia ostreae]|uniref:Uncharacterized protein n=1 Tax=Bonamia ostreae TaxID=126728 RepID=A0ABV2AF83_9EUKA